MKRALVFLLFAGSVRAAPGGSVVGSKHDLSVTGPGPIRAVAEGNPCVFCHIPHDSAGKLSSRPDSKAVYQPYESSTMSARPGAPTGASRICLSCHDGTIAVGKTRNRDIQMMGGAIGPGRRSYIGTDLRRSHPVSFAPRPSKGTRRPHPGDAVKHDTAGELQCTSCHDPHRENGDPLVGKFLVKSTERGELCTSCHDPLVTGATGSGHAASAASFGVAEGNEAGFASVGDAGCLACHASHGGDGKGRLLNRPNDDDDAPCLRCHGSSVAKKSIAADLAKSSAHARQARGVHDAAEGRPGANRSMPEASPASARHVACVDCHDPHRANDRPAVAPGVGGALDGAWGVDVAGNRVEQVQFEYELCFKCHGDSTNQPQQGNPAGPRRVARDSNLRRVFASDAVSFHPVVSPGRNPSVPSLTAPYSAASTITCGDCHASDGGPGAGGVGARGPHGSIYPALLERSYLTADFTPESPTAYALCYKCHERAALLSPAPCETAGVALCSSFPEHARHLQGAQPTPCSTCHTAHGVSSRTGTPAGNAHLVDFDTSVVRPFRGIRAYTSTGPGSGSCTLSCHDHDHDASSYPRSLGAAAMLR